MHFSKLMWLALLFWPGVSVNTIEKGVGGMGVIQRGVIIMLRIWTGVAARGCIVICVE